MQISRQSSSSISRVLVAALAASLLVLFAPSQAPSKADYTSVSPGTITINDRVCNLGDPNDHSTSATAFEITNSDQLWEMTDCVSISATIHFKLGNDIDVSEATVSTASPIGYSTSGVAYTFSGVLDGDNHRVHGISMSTTSYGVGLFAWLAGATVSNLVIAGAFSTSSTIAPLRFHSAGALAVQASGTISLVSISNTANVTGKYNVGGFVGYSNGDTHIISSRNSGAISGFSDVGGFVGEVANTGHDLFVSNSHNYGPVTGADDEVGGIAGIVSGGSVYISQSTNQGTIQGVANLGGLVGEAYISASISHSVNRGNVTGTGDGIGGLVGTIPSVSASVEFSSNEGNIQGVGYVGGLLGDVEENAFISHSFNKGDVTGTGNNVAGLVGYIDQQSVFINNSYNEGDVEGNGDTGGFAGEVRDFAYISYSYNVGNVTSVADDAGGFVGFVEVSDAVIDHSYNSGNIEGVGDAGGFVGDVDDNAYISNSYNSGNVAGTGNNIGGFIGKVDNDSAFLHDSYNTGDIEGGSLNVGGFVGYVHDNVTITSSHNTGAITAQDGVGGFIGQVGQYDAFIFDSYNTGNLNATDLVGGFIGYVDDNVTIISSHNTGNLTANDLVGGFVAQTQDDAIIMSSFNTGTITANDYVGGLLASVDDNATVTSSFNTGTITANDNVGGLIAYSTDTKLNRTFNTGSITGTSSVGGLIGRAASSAITESYNAGAISASNWVDGFVGSLSGTISTNSSYTSVDSQYLSTTPAGQMRIASTYVGYNFSTVWGFGTCSQNKGFPMLRSLGLANNYFIDLCTDPPPPPPRPYEGPVLQNPEVTEVAGLASYEGRRLDTVTKAMAGGQELTIRSATSQSLELQLPAGLESGLYDLVLLSSYGTLTFQQGLRVVASDAAVEPEETETPADGPILTAGSFKGYVAIYTKGYEGQRLSAKVAGKWLVVPELTEFWRGKNYSRTVRFTGAGRTITVDLFIDRKFVKSVQLVTK